MIAPKDIVKTDKQLLAEAGALILQYEQEAKKGAQDIEQLAWQNSRRQITIMALGIHFNLTPDAMKEIVQPYFDKQLEEIKKQAEAIKDKFKADVAAGKKVEFTSIENAKLD